MLSVAGLIFCFGVWEKLNLPPILPIYSVDTIEHFSPIWGLKKGRFHLESTLFIFSILIFSLLAIPQIDANPGSK